MIILNDWCDEADIRYIHFIHISNDFIQILIKGIY